MSRYCEIQAPATCKKCVKFTKGQKPQGFKPKQITSEEAAKLKTLKTAKKPSQSWPAFMKTWSEKNRNSKTPLKGQQRIAALKKAWEMEKTGESDSKKDNSKKNILKLSNKSKGNGKMEKYEKVKTARLAAVDWDDNEIDYKNRLHKAKLTQTQIDNEMKNWKYIPFEDHFRDFTIKTQLRMSATGGEINEFWRKYIKNNVYDLRLFTPWVKKIVVLRGNEAKFEKLKEIVELYNFSKDDDNLDKISKENVALLNAAFKLANEPTIEVD